MDVGPTLEPNPQPLELVQPAERPLDHPAVHSQSTAMFLETSGDLGLDAPTTKLLSMTGRVIRPVRIEIQGPTARTPELTRDRRHGVDQGKQLRHIVGVRSREGEGERHSLTICENMMLRAWAGPIRRVGACLFAPPTARIELESTTARDQSIRSASRSRFKSVR